MRRITHTHWGRRLRLLGLVVQLGRDPVREEDVVGLLERRRPVSLGRFVECLDVTHVALRVRVHVPLEEIRADVEDLAVLT